MKRRILHLITQLPTGGAERLLASVVKMLDPDRFESIVCCIQARGNVAEEIEKSGVRVLCLNKMQKKGIDWQVVAELVKLIGAERIDLMHSHLYHANFYGRIAAWRAGIPAIASIHNTYVQRKWRRQMINRFLGWKSAAVIAVSEDIRRDVLRYDHVATEKIFVLPNGIDLDRVDTDITPEQAKTRIGISSDAIVIGCIGRLEEQKGHIHLLRAFSRLVSDRGMEQKINLRLVLVGDGRLHQQLEKAANQLGIANRVLMLGDRQDVAELLRAFDVFVMPSLWEGLSLAMLEAMAARLPVLISDVGGAAEVLGENEFGIRLPPGDENALTDSIRRLIGDPSLRRNLTEAARKRVEEHYSAAAMTKKLGVLYDKTIAAWRLPSQVS
jgi:L-malate glycosyltransferase